MAVDLKKVKIDISDMDLGDLAQLMDGSFSEQLAVMEKIVTGVNVRKIGILQLDELQEMVKAEVDKASNPQSEE